MKIKINPLKTALCVWRTFCIHFFLPLPHITMYNPLFQLNLLDSESFKEEMPLHMSRLKDLHISSYLSEKAPFPGDSLKRIFSGEYLAKLLCCTKEVSFFSFQNILCTSLSILLKRTCIDWPNDMKKMK